MPPPLADRALRKLVAEIARAHPDDRDALLARLSEDHQERVRGLLRAYLGQAVSATDPGAPVLPEAAETAPPYPAKLSPWILERLQGETKASASPAKVRMTGAARIALKACALEAATDPAFRDELVVEPSAPPRRQWGAAPWRRRRAGR